jgi:predicted DNA binding protein
MRQVRLTVTPTDPSIHPFFALTAGEGGIEEAQSLYCNVADETRPTYLFGIRGDPTRIGTKLDECPEVVAYDISPDEDDMCYVILQLEVNDFGRAILDAFSRDNLTLVLPVVYADGSANIEVVGSHAAIQEFVDALPSILQVGVERIGGFTDGRSADSILTERQRETVLAGLELGYYETPRQVTHEDVAERLDCSPSTASEHLNRAESKLIKAMLNRS